ncbi:MAG: anti-sigma factor [Salinisphaeraceae bacterium]|nr:anti-sigma factor [Salinisphaeraceae bacterium]
MRLESTELRDALAAEYVLGTLRGQARNRFEAIMRDDADLRDLVTLWEGLLDRFNSGIEPVPAPPRLWAAVERRLGFRDAPPRMQALKTGSRMHWLRGLWVSAGVTALLVMALIFSPEPVGDPFAPDLQVVLENKQAEPVWQVQADTRHNILKISAVRPINLPSDRDLELWLVPKSGEPPISLGLMPTQMAHKRLVVSETPLAEGAALAVSLEPKGGSPTGSATGPILYVQSYEIRS